jgi:hypothetical protein
VPWVQHFLRSSDRGSYAGFYSCSLHSGRGQRVRVLHWVRAGPHAGGAGGPRRRQRVDVNLSQPHWASALESPHSFTVYKIADRTE